MNTWLPLLFRHVMYNLRGGFLVRPLGIALTLGCAGALLSWLEEATPAIGQWAPGVLSLRIRTRKSRKLFWEVLPPPSWRCGLHRIRDSLKTLTLASMQFSPRIIISFTRDRETQWTLGRLSRDLLILDGGAAGGSIATATLRSGGNGYGSDAPGGSLCSVAAVLYSPYLAFDQCESDRGQDRLGD